MLHVNRSIEKQMINPSQRSTTSRGITPSVVSVIEVVGVVVIVVSFISAPSTQQKNTIRVRKYNAAQEKGSSNKTINVMACR